MPHRGIKPMIANPPDDPSTSRPAEPARFDRRAYLKSIGALAGVTALGGTATASDETTGACCDCGDLPPGVLQLAGGTPACPVTVRFTVTGALYEDVGGRFECVGPRVKPYDPDNAENPFNTTTVTLGTDRTGAVYRFGGSIATFQATDGDLDVDVRQRLETTP